MSVCNIFKAFGTNPSNNGQGLFLTFSQYNEDLTKEISLGANYRVIPSKFLCLDITSESDFNDEVPQYLQSEYENRMAFLREESTISASDIVKISRYTLFRTLKNLDLLTLVPGENNGPSSYPEIVCGGDINVIANKSIDGMNYSEIYCLLEPSAKKIQLDNSENDIENMTMPVPAEWQSVIKGWSEDGSNGYPVYPASSTGLSDGPIFDSSSYYNSNEDSSGDADAAPAVLDSNVFNDGDVVHEIEDADYFNFNCIIVFYDIYNEDAVLYRGLPLGIWFSGPESDGKLLNDVTKYVRSQTIFGQGTSYGLRICLKNVSTPFGEPVAIEGNDSFCELVMPISELCDMFAQAAIEMQSAAAETSVSLTYMKDWASQFMNARVNVPYIKKIGNDNYWFVNGRNIAPVEVNAEQPDNNI